MGKAQSRRTTAASKPNGAHARLTASMPLHTLPYCSVAVFGGVSFGFLLVMGQGLMQEKGAEGLVAFDSGERHHLWAGTAFGRS